MQNKSLGKNLFIVAFGRIVSLLSGIAVGFILPKILEVTDYGYYKVFTLYAVYTALLHFGFADGILLKISGTRYEELDKLKMRMYTRFYIALELLVSIAMVIVGLLSVSGEYLFIVIALAANMVFVNITTYYQFVSQAVQRFGEYSVKNIVISIVKTSFVLGLLLADLCFDANISYKLYLVGLNILDFSIMIWYVAIYRDITFGQSCSIAKSKKDIMSVFKTGIVLTLAYQVSHLVLALDRQFVSVLFSTEIFAVYSFAYNIVTMISTMVSSLSVVLLPMLKNRDCEVVSKSYKKILSVVAIVASVGLLCYFPLVMFIGWLLPDYLGAIQYVSIVLPAFLFTSAVTVVMFTINKVLDMSLSFFKEGCFILVLGLLFNVVAYCLFGSPLAISYASLLVAMIWFLISGTRLKEKTNVGMYKEFVYLLVIAVGFIVITSFGENIFTEMILYLSLVVLWTAMLYKSLIQGGLKALNSKLGRG